MITLFLGVETFAWQKSDFVQAVSFAKSVGIDRLAVKVADGGNAWYGGIAQGHELLAALNFPVVPYAYVYGGSLLSAEAQLAKEAAAAYGHVILDMESEWDGRLDQAQALVKDLGETRISVTTWADPMQHNWGPLLAALDPLVDEWIPQAYYDALFQDYQDQYLHYPHCAPALSVSFANETDSFVSLMQTTGRAKRDVFVWHYGTALAHVGLVQTATYAYRFAFLPSLAAPSSMQEKAAQDEWSSTAHLFGGLAPSYATGIADAWRTRTYANKRPGPPLTAEYVSVDWNGNTIAVQQFAFERCEWSNGAARWFSENGEVA